MFANRISQKLHEEHSATVAIMERLEALIASYRRGPPAGNRDAEVLLLREIADGVESEVKRHFDFEEQHLFTFLDTIGDAAIGAHLTAEHTAMRPLGERLAALARTGSSAGFDEASWSEFQRVGMDLAERMLTHVQKEEMALLPLLEDAMDAPMEARLYDAYAANA